RVSSVLNSDIGIKWFNRNKDSKGWPNIKSAIDELTDFAISIAETKEARAVIPKKAEILTTYDRNPDTGEYTYLPNSLVMNKVNVQTVTTVSDLPNKLSTAAGDIEPLALSVVPVAKEEIGKRKSIFGLATLIKKGGLIPADKLKKLKPDQYEYKITISYKQDDKVFDELLGGAKETAMFEKLNSTSKGKKQLKYLIDIMDEFNNKKSVNEEEKKAKSQTELQKKQAEDQGIKKEKSQTEGEMKEGELNSYLRK
ncbi:hypothetical protein KKE60_06990, partial [Patescibacteria group bacterium]|nr:hypothetical protein [Patescibacteria group bacterium]